jgi:hypothetical protein
MSELVTLQDKKNALKLAYQIVTDKRNLNRYACTALLVRKDSPELFTYSDMVKALEGMYTELGKAPMMQKPLTFDECMVMGDVDAQDEMIPDPVFLEYKDPEGWTGWVCLRDHYYHPEGDPSGRGLYIMHPGCDVQGKSEFEAYYGKTWRCWASRPTDEERAAAPWEE